MKNFYKGLLFSILPMYSFFSWLYIFNTSPLVTHKERLIAYKKGFLNSSFNLKYLAVLNILFSIIAIVFLLKALKLKWNLSTVFSLVLVIVLVTITFYNLWSLL